MLLVCQMMAVLGDANLTTASANDERAATAPESIRVAQGFEVELLRSAQEGESSWISMTWEPKGDLLVGLDDQGVARLRLQATNGTIPFERLAGTDSFRHVRGILHALGSLYVCATDSQEIYRLTDENQDDEYETQELFQRLAYNSRYGHGMNQLVLGPDNLLYIVIGNDVVFPDPASPTSPYRGPQEDWFLPNPNDLGQDDRVGYIAQVDPAGKQWKIIAGGLRNPFDLAFDRDGEIFTWDADMEWDVGLPWYRPTRLNHIVRGGEYGWRWGTGKWPAWFPDSLPATLNTGYSSPTALAFGYPSRWPNRFRQALYMADWQLGRIFLVDLQVQGASYRADAEVFIEGGPLNVCDMSFGPDGDLYFITGGRGSQSGLYRVRWVGDENALATLDGKEMPAIEGDDLRGVRRELEKLQEVRDATQYDLIWQHLGSQDRWLQFAARVAMENQDQELWQKEIERLLADNAGSSEGPHKNRRLLSALLGMARVGGESRREWVLHHLLEREWNQLETHDLVTLLRAIQLSWLRQGTPTQAEQRTMRERLEPLYPHQSFQVNWLLAELLVGLQSKIVLDDTLDLLLVGASQEEEFQYAKTLLHVDGPWSMPAVDKMLTWLERSRRYHGGRLVETMWNQLRESLENKLTNEQRLEYATRMEQLVQPELKEISASVSPQVFVQEWKMEELLDDVLKLDRESTTRGDLKRENEQMEQYQRGIQALNAGHCLKCHQFDGRGTHVGPDLTGVAKRYDGRALLESIIEPSRQIDPKYLNTTYLLEDGHVVSGRTVGVSSKQLVIEVEPLTGRTETIERSQIEQSSPTAVSPMPQGLLNTMSREEIIALIRLLRAVH